MCLCEIDETLFSIDEFVENINGDVSLRSDIPGFISFPCYDECSAEDDAECDSTFHFDVFSSIENDESILHCVSQQESFDIKALDFSSDDPDLGQWWHLFGPFAPSDFSKKEVSPWVDTHVDNEWVQYGLYGSSVVAVIDAETDINHIEYYKRVRTDLSYDFLENTEDPGGDLSEVHGTAVSGVILAALDNAACGVGVAPSAHLAARRVIGDSTTKISLALSISWLHAEVDIYNNSWGIVNDYDDSPFNVSGFPLFRSAIVQAYTNGRDALGSVILVAAGNESLDSNFNLLSSYPEAFVIAAAAPSGSYAYYSNFGENIMLTAPSGGYGVNGDYLGLSSLVPNDGCTDVSYSGTSFSCPIASGVVALILDAFPEISPQLVRVILHASSKPIDYTNVSTECSTVSENEVTASSNGSARTVTLEEESVEFVSFDPQSSPSDFDSSQFTVSTAKTKTRELTQKCVDENGDYQP
ncbi:Peptidase S8, subtilisin-related like protein, partial [Aduncisulcus paluster]